MENFNKKVLYLREQGLSVKKIAKELNTYSSKVYYVLNPLAKEKHLLAKTIWQNANKEAKLLHSKKHRENYKADTLFKEKLINAFHGRTKGKKTQIIPSVEDFVSKFGRKDIYTCYITGEKIEAKKISLDHVDPTLKKIDFTLNNINITSWKINNMKGTLTLDEFISLCKKVAEFNKSN